MASPTATPDTRVAVIEQSASAMVEYNLDDFPTSEFNRLIPTQTIAMPGDLFRPIVQVVVLDPPDRDGKSPDHYKSTDVPAGHRAPTARGLNKLATAAAISFFDERRLDDGSDPDIIGVTLMASMMLPTGQRITAPGSQLVNIRSWFGPTTSPAELAKFRKQFYAHVSTRARNRAIRGILSLRASYPDAEIAKPFAVVSYAPNMSHPDVRARILDAIAPVAAQVYGPASAPQLAAGPVIAASEAPDDDVADGSLSDEGSPAGGDPDWFAGGTATPAKGDEQLAAALRDKAMASGLSGAMTEAQRPQVIGLLRPLGLDIVSAGLRAAFGPETYADGKLVLTAAQANAILEFAADDTFIGRFRDMAGPAVAA